MQTDRTQWERYQGGSPEAEHHQFERLSREIIAVQARLKQSSGALTLQRTFHAKPLLAVTNARFEVSKDLPKELQVGYMRPGASYPATVRLSNASGTHQHDVERDLRGAAVRVRIGDGKVHDLLMTNFPVPHARDAEQFVAFAKAMSGNRVVGLLGLAFKVGPFETVRMLRNVLTASKRPVVSLALESYWSRGAMLWGDAGPVRYFIRPSDPQADDGGSEEPIPTADLRAEIAGRLANGEVAWSLCVQRFVDEATTPVENAAAEWSEADAPPVEVARLVIQKQDALDAEAAALGREIEELAFNPWHTTEEFRPLGNLNRARKAVYHASASHRLGRRFHTPVPLRNRVATAISTAIFKLVNRVVAWHRLPLQMSLLNLSLFRHELRQKNLIDTVPPEAPPKAQPRPEEIPEDVYLSRRFDGRYNDLSAPDMGSVGAAFGRNLPADWRPDDVGEPNAVTVSRELLTRDTFKPATTLNVLAAAWIQFQVHDWVQHRAFKLGERDVEVPIPDSDTWRNVKGGRAERKMRFAGDKPLFEADPKNGIPAPVYANRVSHWWDGSEVYGVDEDKGRSLLEDDGPRLRLDAGGYLPVDCDGAEITGFNESWWLGLSAMHTLFAREHNAIADALSREYPHWPPGRVYQTARLVVSALIAKIHTVEWTPAILATETIDVGLNANWYGAPKDWLTQLGLWLTDTHALDGIPETLPDHHTAPYALTEDFVTVYRMHPLLPDDYRFYDGRDGSFRKAMGFDALQGRQTDDVMRKIGLHDVLYSLGIAHPGAISLHNYPRALQRFQRADGSIVDLSVVDIMRERTRGVPRYNKFREGLHKPPVTDWDELTADPESVRRLREVYRSIDDVDAMVGLFAETPPAGFGFSDTAFRIFILMATRRLQSDRFLNVDFRPEVYSPLGMDWVRNNGMTSIILRHHPELASVLPRDHSAFAPWRPIAAAAG